MGVTVIEVVTTTTGPRYRTINTVTIHLTMAMATMAVTGVIIMATTATMGTVAMVGMVASISPLAFNDLAFIRSPYQASSIPLLLACFFDCGWLVRIKPL